MLSPRQDPPCPSGKLYWTCLATPQEFHGCCVGNPCHNSGVCPDDPDHLSTTALSTLSRSTTRTTTSTSRTISNINTPTTTQWFASSTASPVPTSAAAPTPVGAIVGGAVGGFFFILAIGCVWLFVLHRRGRKSDRNQHLPLKLAHSRNSSVDTNQYSPAPPVSAWQKQGYLSPLPSPYFDSPATAGSPHKRSYSGASLAPSPYLPQHEESQEVVYSELAAASVDPVELAGAPLMPQSQRKKRVWSEADQRNWEEQRFGRSLDGSTHESPYDRDSDEEDAMGWRDDGRGRR